MLSKGYHLSSMHWSYPNIISIDNFLEDFKNELTKNSVEDTLEFLEDYREKLREDTVTLVFGKCRLEIQGIDEADNTIRGLIFVLENNF
ncbi:hypothetical protein ACSBQ0_17280 [Bacillus altitudinis]|uniref:hypothetical protein n=1 Tax=Bacillus TaxID=1386 RepID=UPI0021058759|nr:hypothetical protein [Bacillus sp. FS02]